MSAYGWLASAGINSWLACVLGILCTIAMVTDIRSSTIPNVLTLSFTVIGTALQTILEGWTGLTSSMLGAGVGFTSVWLLYLFKGVGAGDVKLFAAIGSITGWAPALLILFYAILLSGLIGSLLLIYRWLKQRGHTSIIQRVWWICFTRDWDQVHQFTLDHRSDTLKFPFMLAVFPAVMLLLIFT
jgi:prepilin peptidase CpaA